MARFPKPITDVDREEVGNVVDTMLENEDVGDVECTEQEDGRYTVRPYKSSRLDDDGD